MKHRTIGAMRWLNFIALAAMLLPVHAGVGGNIGSDWFTALPASVPLDISPQNFSIQWRESGWCTYSTKSG